MIFYVNTCECDNWEIDLHCVKQSLGTFFMYKNRYCFSFLSIRIKIKYIFQLAMTNEYFDAFIYAFDVHKRELENSSTVIVTFRQPVLYMRLEKISVSFGSFRYVMGK